IIVPVVEHSVTIAGISTRELITKDFAMEPSEERLRKAGHSMVWKLTGSLTLVTCKEPLKSNLGGHLRNSLIDHGFAKVMVAEQVLSILVANNIEVACSAIKKAAMERAVTDVDDGFAASYEISDFCLQLHAGQVFWDPAAPPANFSAGLPVSLHIKPAGLLAHQLAVYDDFCKFMLLSWIIAL
ncbi:hypothetical protein SCLCIDRAFT_1155385, partial [Scleroderma citrinum Foug A]